MPTPVQQLSYGRIVIGLLSWLAPNVIAKLFGIKEVDEAKMPSRLFGARDLALGVGTLTATGETKAKLVQLGVLCDALDLGAAVVGKREGALSQRTTIMLGAAAASAVAAGVAELSSGS